LYNVRLSVSSDDSGTVTPSTSFDFTIFYLLSLSTVTAISMMWERV
jgi:hypothetical protein